MDQNKNMPTGAIDSNETNKMESVQTSSTAPTQEMPKTAIPNVEATYANGSSTQETANAGKAAKVEGSEAQNASPNVEVTEAPKKKGFWSRIVHSKDSTKLIGSLAFCAVFATCTLLAVTVFDKPGHLDDRRSDIRMEQRADSDRGNMPDMGTDDRSNNGNGMGEFGNRENGSDANGGVPNGTPPNGEPGSSNENSSSDENKSDNAKSNDSDSKSDNDRPGTPPDSQNAPSDSSKSDSSSKSTAVYAA